MKWNKFIRRQTREEDSEKTTEIETIEEVSEETAGTAAEKKSCQKGQEASSGEAFLEKSNLLEFYRDLFPHSSCSHQYGRVFSD